MSDFDFDQRPHGERSPSPASAKNNPDEKPPVEIPMDALSAEILDAVIESFVLREGTDYGRQEVELETKIEQVKKQLAKGLVKIVFDPNSESVTLLTDKEFKKLATPFSK